MPVRRLEPLLIDRIAAGEVIERPAAAVKELVENALDAGASRISVVIEGGGLQLIRVSDDGAGMTPEDLALAVERHATSKLPDGDLEAIATLGFRGEALPSIGSVARLEIVTRHAAQPQASSIIVENGEKSAVRPASLAKGTRIEARGLFQSVPARLKFMKSERSEALAVLGVMKRLAMARPEVRFSLEGQGITGFDYHAGSSEAALIERLTQALGREFRQSAIEIDAEREGFRLSGFAGAPSFTRGTTAEQYLFVNRRPVRDRLLNGAVRAAYADHIASDRHPAAALFLDVSPRLVDVNVHPAKTEVRFRDAGLVRALIVSALKEKLGGTALRAGALPAAAFGAPRQFTMPPPRGGHDWRQSPFAPQRLPGRGFGEQAQEAFAVDAPPQARLAADAAPAAPGANHPLGAARAQLHETYIVAQTRDGVVIVDQHAAHERIVYEKLKRQRAEHGVARQALLIPAVVELDEKQAAALADAAAELETLGLVIEPFGHGAVAVREAPAAIAGGDMGALVRDIADHLSEWGGPLALQRAADHVLATFACHHSVRAGRRLSAEEMNALLREMEKTPGASECNHGRPVFVEMKLADIEKMFGRR